ncbi:MAG TPA: TatD family hydrolase [Gemmatimonadaceae bacterium]|nr:TatD family hydrolase [Gemmatimonadaceae bacterium]
MAVAITSRPRARAEQLPDPWLRAEGDRRVEFIDSHAHLADAAFAEDADDVIGRARATGAAAVVCIATTPDDADGAAALVARHPGFLYSTAGVHPHEARDFDALRDPDRIRHRLDAGAVAIGECGLDYHYDNSPRQQQRRVFAGQLGLARETGRPVVVHTRDAADDTASMVREAGEARVRGVLHCFTGPRELAETAISAGWYISFSGIVTFPKFRDEDLLRMVPDDRLLVESDSPYLAPVPNRGRRNEPAWVPLTIARVAGARGVDVEELAVRTAANARSFFALAPAGGG